MTQSMTKQVIINRFQTSIFLLLICSLLTAAAASPDDQLRLIRGAYQDGIFDMAQSEALAFLKTAGQHSARGEVNLILGYIARKSGRISKAEKYFTSATSSDDFSIRLQAYYEIANIAWSKGDFDKAATNYQAIIDENHSGNMNTLAKYWLIMSLSKTDQYEHLIKTVNTILSKDPEFSGNQIIQSVFSRGTANYHLGNFDEAVKDLRTVYESETSRLSEEAALLLAQIYLEKNDLRMADLWASRRISKGYQRQAYLIRSALSLEEQDWGGAMMHYLAAAGDDKLEKFERAFLLKNAAICEARILMDVDLDWWTPLVNWLEKNPDSDDIGTVLAEMSSISLSHPFPEELLVYLDSAADWIPGKHGIELARLHLGKKDYEGSLNWLIRYYSETEELPTSSARLLLAHLLTATGDHKAGMDELKRLEVSLGNLNKDEETSLQQADLFFQAGMYQKAVGLYQDILVSENITTEYKKRSLFQVAESYFQMESWSLAAKVFLKLAETYPAMSAIEQEIVLRRRLLSLVYSRQWKTALPVAHQYLEKNPETQFAGEVYYLRGLTEANLDMLDEALITLGKALDRIDDTEHIETVKETIRMIKNRKTENAIEKP